MSSSHTIPISTVLHGFINYQHLPDLLGDPSYDRFEAIAVLPGPKMPASRSIVPWIDGVWETLAADPGYARNWSNLLADMLQVFWDAEYVRHGIPAGDFLDEHSPAVIEAVSSLAGWTKQSIEDQASAYRDAANFHNLVVDPGQESVTIARFSLMLQARVAQSI